MTSLIVQEADPPAVGVPREVADRPWIGELFVSCIESAPRGDLEDDRSWMIDAVPRLAIRERLDPRLDAVVRGDVDQRDGMAFARFELDGQDKASVG